MASKMSRACGGPSDLNAMCRLRGRISSKGAPRKPCESQISFVPSIRDSSIEQNAKEFSRPGGMKGQR